MENATVDFDSIQAEQAVWSVKNFGEQPAYRPMLGIIEELCELDEADNSEDEAEVEDALGDVAIYMLDYCGKRQWRMQELWDARACPEWLGEYTMAEYGMPYLSGFIKNLAHSQLKGEQNIRGGVEKHDAVLKSTLSSVLWLLDELAKHYNKDFQSILAGVWEKVSKRDWTKNPNTAHEVGKAAEGEGTAGG